MSQPAIEDNEHEYADSERTAAWALSGIFFSAVVAVFFAQSLEFQIVCYGALLIAGLYYVIAAGVVPELCYPDRPQWAMRSFGFGMAALAAGVALPPFVPAVETYRWPLVGLAVVLIGMSFILAMRSNASGSRA